MKTETGSARKKNYWMVIACFAAIYTIWGSTYIAIHFALETIPPFFMAGCRFVTAGAILYIFSRFSGAPKPEFIHLKNASLIGILLLVFGNGGVVYAQQFVPSGVAALIVSIEPVWVVLLVWLSNSGKAPSWYAWIGLLLGMVGMMVLLGAGSAEIKQVSLKGFLILLSSTFCWALGSVYAVKAATPASPIMSTSLQMLAGGFVLSIISYLIGEWNVLQIDSISTTSWVAVLYLIIFGSLIGYSAYSYLTRVAPPSQVSTYAYVNPVIAVFLGTWLGREVLTKQILFATPVLVVAVVLLIWQNDSKDKNTKQLEEERLTGMDILP